MKARINKLITKLWTLGLNPSLCNWILDFLTGQPHVVRVGNQWQTVTIGPRPQRPRIFQYFVSNSEITKITENLASLNYIIIFLVNEEQILFDDFMN